jgi:predicted polyphosphate/ATP-dependent NAD kinase
MTAVGFLVNPIAGMGGRVGLKGTDGVVDQAIAKGARPSSHFRAEETLRALRRRYELTGTEPDVRWLTCSGAMGADVLASAGFGSVEVVHESPNQCGAADTKKAVGRFAALGARIVLFCGGDGTARDICNVVGTDIPILGIPSGVKMYSGVFGANPTRTADILFEYLHGQLELASVEILDLDEEEYRRGEWVVRLYHEARTPYEPTFTGVSSRLNRTRSSCSVRGAPYNPSPIRWASRRRCSASTQSSTAGSSTRISMKDGSWRCWIHIPVTC